MRSIWLVCAVTVLIGLMGADTASAAGRDAARRLAAREFPEFLGGSTGAPAPLPNGLRIAAPLSETVARVETATGHAAGVASFTHPVARRVGGRLQVVDLDLVAAGSKLRSRRPVVDVRYPRRADGSVDLPHVAFTVPDARAVTTAPQGGELFFADALGADTDYALVPKSDGVEALWQLRSAASPETLRLRFDGRLRAVPEAPGTVEALAADGRVVATVSAPVATDADGTAVPVSAAVDGRDVVYTVDHRDSDLSYPILVDPTVAEYWSPSVAGEPGGGFQNCGDDMGMHSSGAGAWSYGQSIPAGSTAFLPACDMRQFGWGYGLYVLQYADSAYVNGAAGLWIWAAPTDTYISAVTWQGLGHRPGNNVAGNTTLFAGIGNIFVGYNAYNEWGPALHMNFTQSVSATNHAASQGAIIGLRVNGNGSRSIGGYSRTDGAIVYLKDDFTPTASVTALSPAQTSWFDPAVTSPSYRMTLGDRGLGVYSYGVERNDTGAALTTVTLPCFGTKVWACPKSYDTGLHSIPGANIPEGITPVHGSVFDAQEREGASPTWYLRADRTPPQISFSGAAYTNRANLIDPTALVKIVGTDGTTASNATQRSGMKTLNIYADGALLSNTGTLSCPGANCQAVLDVGLQSLSPGAHTISAIATDQLNHTSSASFTVNIAFDRTQPDVELGGELYDQRSESLTGDGYDLWVDAIDTGTGTTSIQILVDGATASSISEPCAAGSCSLEHEWTFERGTYAVGAHTVTVRVSDGAGNVTAQSFGVNLSATESPEDDDDDVDFSASDFTAFEAATTADEKCDGLGRGLAGGEPVDVVSEEQALYRETTFTYDDGSYFVIHCEPDGSLIEAQHVGPLETPDGTLMVPLSTTKPDIIDPADPDGVNTDYPIYANPEDPDVAQAWASGVEYRAGHVMRATVGTQLVTAATATAVPFKCLGTREPNYMTHTWATDTWKYYIRTDTFPDEHKGPYDSKLVVDRILDGVRTWNTGRNACHKRRLHVFHTQRQSEEDDANGSIIQFQDKVTCNDPDNEPGATIVGCTSVHRSGKRRYTFVGPRRVADRAVIRFNKGTIKWWVLKRHRGCDGRTDLWSVAAHEVGHVVGLDDLTSSNDWTTTMYKNTDPCQFDKRKLGRLDRRGLYKLYHFRF